MDTGIFRSWFRRVSVPIIAAALVAALFPVPAQAVGSILDVHEGLEDLDARSGRVAPTASQRAIVRRIGAHVRWNRFGTPASLLTYDGYLATGLSGDAVTVARQWLQHNAALFRLTPEDATHLELLSDSPMVGSTGHAVIFRQSFGGMPAGVDGLITLGVQEGKVAYVSSTAAGSLPLTGSTRLGSLDALVAAARHVGLDLSNATVTEMAPRQGWTRFHVKGLSHPQQVRPVAIPTLARGARRGYEVLLLNQVEDGHSLGYSVFLDSETGHVFVRTNIVDQLTDNPRWKYFKNYPPLDLSDRDTRILGCWLKAVDGKAVSGCDRQEKNPSSPLPWDVDPQTGQPTFTTRGNNAQTALSSLSPLTPAENYSPISPEREYIYPWKNYWHDAKCPRHAFSQDMENNDVNASITSLFVSHNRLHDWSYKLGFTEQNFNMQKDNFGKGGRPGDPELGDSQAGALTGGSPTYTGRDNANQATPPDGTPPFTNMYLWQPIAAAFYPPCVDGDYDMSVIGHEYTHAISNRMVAGPDSGLAGRQPGSMGESWSDLVAQEYLVEYGYVPTANENPFAVGPYVTGSKKKGIRNYAMNRSPLNYSDVGYDFVGQQVHADGEIWSATNFDIRKLFVKKYNRRFPASNRGLQRRCAEGRVAVTQCPGNRRWIQIVFDAFLLMQSDVTMVDARDAYLKADQMRFKGANQKILWKAFAKRGLGAKARYIGPTDSINNVDDGVRATFASPKHREGLLRFKLVNTRGKRVKGRIFVGMYEARVNAIADTRPKTKLPAAARFVRGRYRFIAQARGYGMARFRARPAIGRRKVVRVRLQKNWASKANKARAIGEATAAGPITALIDDTEATNWTISHRGAKGATATVDLAGRRPKVIRRIQVSAMLRPRNRIRGEGDPRDPSQSRFSALRAFKILTCKARQANNNCRGSKGYRLLFTSRANAFPSGAPRPLAPDLILRSYRVSKRRATHVRLVVVSNQCTGTKAYHGEQDSDPTNDTDCREGSSQDDVVRAAELQVFSRRSRVR